MERNIGTPNRRIPPDVQPKGSTSRDLEHREEPPAQEQQDTDDDTVVDHD